MTRNPKLPAVPTLHELGYRNVDLSNWFAVYAPADTPAAVVRKLGQKVAVCYDGKWGRRVMGEIIATHRGSAITVRFQEWAGESILTHKFRRRARKKIFGGPPHYWGGYVPVADSLMRSLWGASGDYYAVWEWE